MNLTRKSTSVALAIAGVMALPSCVGSGIANHSNSTSDSNGNRYVVRGVQHGKASWYCVRSNTGTRTASGQKLCNYSPTAAHKTLPMGTKVRVTNQTNGRSEIVTINDRGPFIAGRIIDLTVGVAERLGFRQRGVAPVKVEVLGHVNER